MDLKQSKQNSEALLIEIAKLRATIENWLAERGIAPPLQDGQSLFLSGALDSVSAIKLVLILEEEFDLSLEQVDFRIDQIDNWCLIESLVRCSTIKTSL